MQLVQRVDGVEVFNSDVTAAVSPANEVISVAGQFFPGAASAQESRRGQRDQSPRRRSRVAALDLTGHDYAAADFVADDDRTGGRGPLPVLRAISRSRTTDRARRSSARSGSRT